MPVIVVGADTKDGRDIIAGLIDPGREVRAFVTDLAAATELKRAGVKVAIGDVSDDSHVQGAATNCFTAVFVTEAARDDRERSFAVDEIHVLEGWAAAAAASDVTRVIWVHEGEVPLTMTRESVKLSPAHPDLVAAVVALDDARSITREPG